MTSTTLRRSVAVSMATGFASLALAVPATAMELPDPTGVGTSGPGTTSTSDGIWTEVGFGALGGIALAGAGFAAVATMRHRHAAHPA